MPRSLRFLSASAVVAEPPAELIKMESDLVVILAAMLCALICVVGLVAVARCAWLRRSNTSGAGAAARPPPQANKGIKKKNLELLPKFMYGTAATTGTGKEGSKGFTWTECAICLAEFVEGEEVRVLPQCGHGFHVGCIDMWLGSHSSCPSCRQILVVARCQKCGQLRDMSPSSSSSSCGGAAAASTRVQLKVEDSTSSNASTTQNATFLP
ncbi:hypothetical protein Tsubulata_012447 [Turnera subulata]|uniref:RING-type domain-containing protein n=1 Tax=Turnera subulata TaxID=218843 RepID=A0A9Q0JSP0_9ROSI|nr:hypothetical protein Tsubulata_012447 [Turnera subulata]